MKENAGVFVCTSCGREERLQAEGRDAEPECCGLLMVRRDCCTMYRKGERIEPGRKTDG